MSLVEQALEEASVAGWQKPKLPSHSELVSKAQQEGEKACALCEKVKPMSAFNKRSASPDGRYHQCRECAQKKQKEYRKK